jgi:general secretion pathway protein N
MTRRRGLLLAFAAGIVFAVALLPLSVVLAVFAPRDTGLSARLSSGPLWSGVLYDAAVAGIPLGNVSVSLRPLPLLAGQVRFAIVAPALAGTVSSVSGRMGLENASGVVDMTSRLKPLPIGRFTLDKASVVFAGGRCVQAEGRIQTAVTGDLGGLALPGGMSGVLRCDGGALVVPLVGQSGLERIDLRITGTGTWRGEVNVRTNDVAVVGKLTAAGFAAGPEGYRLRLSGAL